MTGRARRYALLLAGAAAVVAWAAFAYALTWHAYGSHSDSANAARAGHDLVTGNVALHGWRLPADSYWSIDLPVFGGLAALLGLGPRIVHLGPLLIAAGGIGLSLWTVGRGGRVRPAGLVGLAAPLLLLGLPHAFLAYIFFQGPWHVGTAVLCLLAFNLASAPLGSRRWWTAVVVLTAAVAGDPIALALGVAPIAGASLLRAWRTGRGRDVVHGLVSGLAPPVAAGIVRLTLSAVGGFTVATTETSPLSNVASNLRHVPRLLGALFGVGSLSGLATGTPVRTGGFVAVAHWVGAAGVTAAVLSSTVGALGAIARRRPDTDRWIDDVLVLGFWASVAAYGIVAAPGAGFAGARYLPAPLLFGVTLAGRRLGDLAAAGIRSWDGSVPAGGRPPVVVGSISVVVGLVLSAGYLGGSLRLLAHQAPTDPDDRLAATLISRHLTFGYAPYWIAGNAVLRSGGRLTIIPVESVEGRLRPFDFYADRSALRRPPPAASGTFVVYRADTGWGNVDTAAAETSFGPPATTETLGPYTLLTYAAPSGGPSGAPSLAPSGALPGAVGK